MELKKLSVANVVLVLDVIVCFVAVACVRLFNFEKFCGLMVVIKDMTLMDGKRGCLVLIQLQGQQIPQ